MDLSDFTYILFHIVRSFQTEKRNNGFEAGMQKQYMATATGPTGKWILCPKFIIFGIVYKLDNPIGKDSASPSSIEQLEQNQPTDSVMGLKTFNEFMKSSQYWAEMMQKEENSQEIKGKYSTLLFLNFGI